MAKKGNKTDDQFAQIEQSLSSTEQFIEKNQKQLTIIVGSIVAVIALVIGYQKLYLAPMEENAQTDMFMAQLYFEKDSFNLALNGDGQYLGFLDIIDDYSLTKAGDLALYYTGLCYLNTGDFESAIEYLKDFSSDDVIFSALALGCIGDAYMELEETDKALRYYKDAANHNENDFTTPRYMFKRAVILEKNGDLEDALALYKKIEENYPLSKVGQEIEKYISRVENAL